MVPPVSTYRVQLTKEFDLRRLIAVVDYLDALGVTDVYVSPFLGARRGSLHGYDVVEHRSLNPEIGDDAQMAELHRRLAARGMGLVADVVPNHMCVATNDNAWWNDVLENGPSSPYAKYFDIEWRPPKAELKDKILLPVLGDQYGRVLENAELQLGEDGGAISVHYGDRRFPIGPGSYGLVLRGALERLSREAAEGDAAVQELESIMTAADRLPARSQTAPEAVRERQREKEVLKSRLRAWLADRPAARPAFDAALREMNGQKGRPRSFDALEALLAEQAYRLSFWRVAAEQINYRRFFDINDLAAIRIEEPEVLEAVHAKIFDLMGQGFVTALRVDHVDGLREPRRYLENLAERAGRPYIVVEKILAPDERLPADWAVAGTTGYDFLNDLNGLFVARSGEKALRALHDRLSADATRPDDVIFEAKRLILQTSMSSELSVLARRLERIAEQHRFSRDFTVGTLNQVLIAAVACFPVYRTYIGSDDAEVSPDDARSILAAIARAKRRSPSIDLSAFDFLRDLLLLRHPDGLSDEQRAERRDFVLRFQELTGPVMAKGVEDTAFYRYFPLLSLNEVGGDPRRFGTSIDEFHARMAARSRACPLSLSATSTHDTKRAEDNRARLAVLSEVAGEWAEEVDRWRALAEPLKSRVAGDAPAPDDQDEYYIYQTLLGALPERDGGALPASFLPRLQGAIEKALREAKRQTAWTNVDATYEDAARTFVARLLDPAGPTLAPILAFVDRVRVPGYWTALSQLVIKATAPGVPDFFQGTELWDLDMVDPDNRRPVDFARRTEWLAGLPPPSARTGAGESDRASLVADLAGHPGDGRVKLLLTQALLTCRRRHRDLFLSGSYQPLAVRGPRRDHLVAFARRRGQRFAVVVAGRFFAQLGAWRGPPPASAWAETSVEWPADLPGGEVYDVVSDLRRRVGGAGEVPASDLLAPLPFCVLVGGR